MNKDIFSQLCNNIILTDFNQNVYLWWESRTFHLFQFNIRMALERFITLNEEADQSCKKMDMIKSMQYW